MKKLSKITESIWSDIQDRSMGNVRKEDGMIIGQLEDGTKLIIPNEAWTVEREETVNGQTYYIYRVN